MKYINLLSNHPKSTNDGIIMTISIRSSNLLVNGEIL